MIAKKTKKTNTKKATTKPYNLNDVKTKSKTKQPKKQGNGALNLFFSVIGFVVVIGGLATMFVPTKVKADTITKRGNGTFIVEDFDCTVALANYAELKKSVENTPRDDFKYPIFLLEYEAVLDALREHTECWEVE